MENLLCQASQIYLWNLHLRQGHVAWVEHSSAITASSIVKYSMELVWASYVSEAHLSCFADSGSCAIQIQFCRHRPDRPIVSTRESHKPIFEACHLSMIATHITINCPSWQLARNTAVGQGTSNQLQLISIRFQGKHPPDGQLMITLLALLFGIHLLEIS